MRFNAACAIISSLLIIPVVTLPGLEKKSYCLKDKCQKEVAAGPKNGGAASARKDCSSFLRKTVTPCPVTTTKTVTSFKTAKPVTTPATTTVRTTTTVRKAVTLPVTATTTPTTTGTSTLTVVFSLTDTVAETSTITFPTDLQTVIVTQTTTVFQPAKRAAATIIPGRYYDANVDNLEARNGAPHCPATQTAAKLPAYACCSKASAYSLACSCIGVTKGSMTTLPVSTITKTTTICKTITPHVTKTATAKQTSTTAITSTITTLITITAEAETVTEVPTTSLATTTTTTTTALTSETPSSTTTTTTIASVPTTCPYFQLQAVGGPINGQYVLSQGNSQKLAFTPSLTSAAVFTINGSGQLVTNGLIANTDNTALYYVYLDTEDVISSNGYVSLICQKTSSLSCATPNGQTRFAVCPAIGPGDPSPGPALLFGTTYTADCSYITLTTLPAPQCG